MYNERITNVICQTELAFAVLDEGRAQTCGREANVLSVAAANRNEKRRLPSPDVASANNEPTGDRDVSST